MSKFRNIPSVSRLFEREGFEALTALYGKAAVLQTTRDVLDELRRDVASGGASETASAPEHIEGLVRDRVARAVAPSLQHCINATGILIHTNLGRAPLSEAAASALAEIARGYSNLELDLASGKRGSRHRHATALLEQLFLVGPGTPGRKALVVNNAAAAVMLSLNTFARGKEVVISRGELVEIGGSFRVPDILERSGARLREVGTTNKTRIADYEAAIGPDTGALLRVHPSNFRIVGFTESATTEALVALGAARGLPVIEDFGSGNLLSLDRFGLAGEPTVAESLASGVDLTIFSGDKLLGGPQSGILLGSAERIAACRANPMARALRVDKLIYAALEATLAAHVRGRAFDEIPVLAMLAMPAEAIRARAVRFTERLRALRTVALDVLESTSRVGGGAAADAEIPTWVVSIHCDAMSADAVLEALRRHRPPVIARISEDRVLIDLRTVGGDEEATLEAAISSLEQPGGGELRELD